MMFKSQIFLKQMLAKSSRVTLRLMSNKSQKMGTSRSEVSHFKNKMKIKNDPKNIQNHVYYLYDTKLKIVKKNKSSLLLFTFIFNTTYILIYYFEISYPTKWNAEINIINNILHDNIIPPGPRDGGARTYIDTTTQETKKREFCIGLLCFVKNELRLMSGTSYNKFV